MSAELHIGLACDIEYAETGQQQGGVPILCLHGIGGSYESFAPQLEELGKQCHLIAWNMPGYGRSTALDTTDFTGLAEKLTELLDALQIDKVHLLGHSIGGMLALEVALTQPQRIASLILLGTTSAFGNRSETFNQQFLAARLGPLDRGQSMTELAEQFVPQLVGSESNTSAISAGIKTMQAIPEASYRTILKCLVTFDHYNDLPQITSPVCLIAGEKDKAAPAGTMQKMAGRLSNAQYHVLNECGHLMNLEAPDACHRIIREFMRNNATHEQ